MNAKLFFVQAALFIVIVAPATALADVSAKQARDAITKIGGMALPSKAVRIRSVDSSDPTMPQVAADVELVFRISQTVSGEWRVSEVRAGQDRWEPLEMIAHAAGVTLPSARCYRSEDFQPSPASGLSVKRARCLVAELFGVRLPSDAVRIKSVSGLGVPLATQESVIAEALVRVDARLDRDEKGWHVREVRSADSTWLNVGNIATTVAEEKRRRAVEQLNIIANALESFRRDRGAFVITDKHPALIDHLSPRYLAEVIRVDPWNRPYDYQGEHDHFVLRSAGPDGKLNTPDDVVLSRP